MTLELKRRSYRSSNIFQYIFALSGGNERPENQCNSQEPGTCNESSPEGTIPGTVLVSLLNS